MNARANLYRNGVWIWIVLMILLRFLFWNDTVFILDEPLFQMKIDEHFANGTFPLSSFRGSSIPLPYGAGAMWFYMVARLVFWHPVALVLYHITTVTSGVLIFLRALQQKFGEEPTRWSGLLLATSPLLFYFSRHLWDNTLLFTVNAIVVWCLVQLEARRRELLLHVIMGIAVGYALNIHLMYGPVAIALGVTLVLRDWQLHGLRSRNFWLPILAFGGTALLLLLPYFWESYQIIQAEHSLDHSTVKDRWGNGRNIWWLIQRSFIFSSIWGSRPYLKSVHENYNLFVGQPLAFLVHNDLFGWFAKIAAFCATVAYPFQCWRKRAQLDPLRLFAFLSLASMVVVLDYLNIPTEPHYFHAVWFLVFVGVAVVLPQLKGLGRKLFLTTLLLTALVNTAYILTSLTFFHLNKGARNYGFSVSIGEQMRAIREICVEASARIPKEARVDLGETWVMGPSFQYLPKHMPECAGVNFTARQKLPNANFSLSHPTESATKADLLIHWVAP